MPTLFATVGTTEFPPLMSFLTSTSFIDQLVANKVTKLTIQYGRSTDPLTALTALSDFKLGPSTPPFTSTLTHKTLTLTSFPLAPSLLPSFAAHTHTISHAGAGTILDCAPTNTRLMIIPNETLMNNHQVELAAVLPVPIHTARLGDEDLSTKIDDFLGAEKEVGGETGGGNMDVFLKIVEGEIEKGPKPAMCFVL